MLKLLETSPPSCFYLSSQSLVKITLALFRIYLLLLQIGFLNIKAIRLSFVRLDQLRWLCRIFRFLCRSLVGLLEGFGFFS